MGAGIPAEKLSHIFDLFYTTSASATGVGLALVKLIIASLGGR